MAMGKLLTVPKERERGRETHFTFFYATLSAQLYILQVAAPVAYACLQRNWPPPVQKVTIPPFQKRKDRRLVDRRSIKEIK